ncbi:MAG: topoisomerase DNA-binding C4 zinc finger domain-containing protein [Victivallales bacterium]|nr:topoisomerase DNA-binding C4 zinc finger domain-containing protein [Victivallales bacterium]
MKQMDEQSDEAAVVGALLSCFPETFPFEPPATVGRKKYDDAKFIANIRSLYDKRSPITERQWNALLMTSVKYSADHPEIQAVLKEHNLTEKADAIKAAVNKHDDTPKEPVSLEALALIKAMDKVEFEAPVKRAGRTRVYDDAKFVKSLRDQAEAGKALSEAQTKALMKVAAKYSSGIANYSELVASIAAVMPDAVPVETAPAAEKAEEPAKPAVLPEAKQAEIDAMLKMTTEITEWKSGRGKYDDKSFVESLSKQFKQRKALSDKQINALLKVLGKYSEQIADFEARSKGFTAVAQPKAQEDLGVCPLCGSKLVTRYYKGRSFVGCSGYPNCKYIKK